MKTTPTSPDPAAIVTCPPPQAAEMTPAAQTPAAPRFRGQKFCNRCKIHLAPRMMEFHRSHAHLLLHCQLCGAVARQLGFSRDRAVRGQFCSIACKEEAGGRGLCGTCSREPDGTFKQGTCGRCRRSYGNAARQIGQINGILGAMNRAQVLPLFYQRLKPGLAARMWLSPISEGEGL